ncbi:MAG TPA: GMC family oxidoreductase [Bryobacteraceae bacterium]|nr:GMC family oxidoreductase [Bryobacteraceae bacterium]
MFQIIRNAPVYDVVIVGSGAGGGTATKVLTDLGISVCLLEAGPMLNPAHDFKEHMWPYQVPHRGVGDDASGYFGRSPYGFGYFSATFGNWELEGEPYTTAPGNQFRWFRSRIVGGRTNHYGRISLRLADYDFKSYTRDGVGTDWPIGYDDISPYYDKAESFIGVTGSKEGIRSAPDGIFQKCPPPRVHEVLVQKACQKLGIPCIPSRLAIITQETNGRPPCHYCAQCGRGCISSSNYSASQVQVFPALKSGKLQLITNAMARELISDDEGKVKAVSYVDKTTRTEKQVRCRAVVLAASACESARLLLNSKSSRHSNGLANSSGQVGRNLTDSVGYDLSAHIPALENLMRHNSDGMGGMHVYVPWWLWDKKLDFPRGYHIEIGGGFGMPQVGTTSSTCENHEGYGKDLKNAIYRDFGTRVGLSGRGEMIPNEHTYAEIDPNVVDEWGIPVLRFHFQWTDAELKQVDHMEQTFTAILETMGGKILGSHHPERHSGQKISIGGMIIHEVGTVRMGDDPAKAPLNKYSQAHDVKNLFVADGGPFVSNPDKNPTLTITALSWRMSEYLAEEMRKGNV